MRGLAAARGERDKEVAQLGERDKAARGERDKEVPQLDQLTLSNLRREREREREREE